MELSKQELIEILDERLDARFKANSLDMDARFKQNKEETKAMIYQAVSDEGARITSNLKSEIQASENRTKAELGGEIRAAEKRVTDSMSDIVGEGVIPEIEQHEIRLIKLEQKLAV